MTDTKIRQSEALYDTLLAEEAAGAAKGEGEIELQLSEDKRRLKSEKMQEHLVSTVTVFTRSLEDSTNVPCVMNCFHSILCTMLHYDEY